MLEDGCLKGRYQLAKRPRLYVTYINKNSINVVAQTQLWLLIQFLNREQTTHNIFGAKISELRTIFSVCYYNFQTLSQG